MRPSDASDTPAPTAPRSGMRPAGAFLRSVVHSRSRWLVVALLVILVLVAGAAFLVGTHITPGGDAQPLPASVRLPPRAKLVWYDNHLDAHEKDWNYTVAGATNASLAAFYQAQLPRDGWQCVRAMTSTNITRNGQAYTGASIYITALRGNMKAQIYTADQGYGGFLLQGDLPENAVALRISLEIEDHLQCV